MCLTCVQFYCRYEIAFASNEGRCNVDYRATTTNKPKYLTNFTFNKIKLRIASITS